MTVNGSDGISPRSRSPEPNAVMRIALPAPWLLRTAFALAGGDACRDASAVSGIDHRLSAWSRLRASNKSACWRGSRPPMARRPTGQLHAVRATQASVSKQCGIAKPSKHEANCCEAQESPRH